MKKKENFFGIITIMVIIGLMFAACDADGSSNPAVKYFTVKFNLNYDGSAAETSVKVADGAMVAKPADPMRNDWTFEGWFTTATGTTAYIFNTSVTANITLYAKWEIIPDPPVVSSFSPTSMERMCPQNNP